MIRAAFSSASFIARLAKVLRTTNPTITPTAVAAIATTATRTAFICSFLPPDRVTDRRSVVDVTTRARERALSPRRGRWASAAVLPGSRRVRCLALAYGRPAGRRNRARDRAAHLGVEAVAGEQGVGPFAVACRGSSIRSRSRRRRSISRCAAASSAEPVSWPSSSSPMPLAAHSSAWVAAFALASSRRSARAALISSRATPRRLSSRRSAASPRGRARSRDSIQRPAKISSSRRPIEVRRSIVAATSSGR